MNWLARLKNAKGIRDHATKPAEPGFVGFVAQPDMGTRGSIGFAARLEEGFQILPQPVGRAANDPHPVVPQGLDASMSDVEIDLFIARVQRFTGRGVGLDQAESLADALVLRDREGDDRRLCIECRHLTAARSCGRAHAAGLSQPELGDLALLLQRCDAFWPVTPDHKK